jgi:hypothetical protein
MSLSKRPHDALSALNANVDGLWRYQLRDENRALLLKIEALEKTSRALPTKLDQRFNENASSIETLVVRVAAVEEENRQIKEERRVCRDELARLKEQVRALWQQDEPRESRRCCVKNNHSLLQESYSSASYGRFLPKWFVRTSLAITMSRRRIFPPAMKLPSQKHQRRRLVQHHAARYTRAPPKHFF